MCEGATTCSAAMPKRSEAPDAPRPLPMIRKALSRTRPSATPARYGFQNLFGFRSIAPSLREEEDVRPVAGLGLEHLPFARPQQARDRAVRIRQIAEGERAGRADLDARRLLAPLHAVQAEGALVH